MIPDHTLWLLELRVEERNDLSVEGTGVEPDSLVGNTPLSRRVSRHAATLPSKNFIGRSGGSRTQRSFARTNGSSAELARRIIASPEALRSQLRELNPRVGGYGPPRCPARAAVTASRLVSVAGLAPAYTVRETGVLAAGRHRQNKEKPRTRDWSSKMITGPCGQTISRSYRSHPFGLGTAVGTQ